MEIEGYTIDESRLPRHVAIIMDGNGRWAKKRKMPRIFGHRTAMKAVRQAITTASDLGIEVLTLYAFSTENWKRSAEEVSGLMSLAIRYFLNEIKSMNDRDIRVQVIGNVSGLPEGVQKAAHKMLSETADNQGMVLNLALNYGGREELVHAARKIAEAGLSPEDIDAEQIEKYLYTSGQPDPDLVVRTSGEKRLSNFLLWQIAYAEFIFDDILWPDFTPSCFYKWIVEYQHRNRRYGGIK
ncbi:isoprenyl transferase [Pseudoramibacter sp.]|jgi:undecaprenyl diphosphate synthase|uniref:isoprenyl transferase n=1 Tax=Pseudoramibacter sp. TaxID=2034862 RepID=UPI0025EC803E|nr:isoprenyl transferase [Pseudoramibacter sp.]MCH4073170.1 isoprenyl transferase [Pseudoramibacter sp.]MCH4106942.1 isoprenyl transferase [Pseudoramibacter sp.]